MKMKQLFVPMSLIGVCMAGIVPAEASVLLRPCYTRWRAPQDLPVARQAGVVVLLNGLRQPPSPHSSQESNAVVAPHQS
jgi:hypothetical protein